LVSTVGTKVSILSPCGSGGGVLCVCICDDDVVAGTVQRFAWCLGGGGGKTCSSMKVASGSCGYGDTCLRKRN
jgi:hypothetical protein